MQVIAGYLFTVLNYVFYCLSRFCRKKQAMLAFDLLAKCSVCTALFFLGSLGGSYSMMVSFFVLIAANIKERRGAKWPALYALFEALLVGILIREFAGISSVLVFLTSSLSLLSIWWFPPQKMRIASLVTSSMSLLYMLSIRNWAGLLEILVLGSNALSYLKYRNNGAYAKS